MTCIVALKHKGKVYMGGDSAGVAGLSVSTRLDHKVHIIGKTILMGFTSSFRMGQLLAYSLKIPTHPKNMSTEKYLSTIFIDEIRRCLSDGGFSKNINGSESGGVFLIGYKGRIFNIFSDYQVAENIHPYSAVGCGSDLALGSLYSTNKLLAPNLRLKKALEAASEFSGGVRAPFIFKSI